MIGDAPLDLTDPATLAGQCEAYAASMRLQAEAVSTNNGMNGLANPAFTYGRVADLLTAAATFAIKHVPPPPEEPKKPDATGADAKDSKKK